MGFCRDTKKERTSIDRRIAEITWSGRIVVNVNRLWKYLMNKKKEERRD